MELLTVVVAGVLALAGAWLGAWWGGRSTKDQWLRDVRLRLYGDVLASATAALQFPNEKDHLRRTDHAIAQLRLVASPEADEAVRAMVRTLVVAQESKVGESWPVSDPRFLAYIEAEKSFIAACARDLGIEED